MRFSWPSPPDIYFLIIIMIHSVDLDMPRMCAISQMNSSSWFNLIMAVLICIDFFNLTVLSNNKPSHTSGGPVGVD